MQPLVGEIRLSLTYHIWYFTYVKSICLPYPSCIWAYSIYSQLLNNSYNLKCPYRHYSNNSSNNTYFHLESSFKRQKKRRKKKFRLLDNFSQKTSDRSKFSHEHYDILMISSITYNSFDYVQNNYTFWSLGITTEPRSQNIQWTKHWNIKTLNGLTLD